MSQSLLFGALLCASWGACLFARNAVLAMIGSAGHIRPNYAGQQIPVSAGLLFPLVSTAFAGGLAACHVVSYRLSMAFCVLTLGFGLLGLVDDLMGSRDKSGLRGHLMSLVTGGGLTTGGLKALYGSLLAVLASSIIGGQAPTVILRAVVLALSANFVNLLDLRPGRAIKGFVLVIVVCLIAALSAGSWNWQGWYLLSGLLGSVLAYAPTDFRARAMMGDVGSNVLGSAAGFSAVLISEQLGSAWMWGSLVLLVLIHLYAEKASISRTIEANPVLRAIDGLGREKK